MWFGNSQIAVKMTALPRGTFEQIVFRGMFQHLRANDLGRKPELPGSSLDDTITRAVAAVRTNFPTFEPHIDWQRLAALRRH